MRIRSRSRDRSRGGGKGADSDLLTLLSYGATDVFDFVANQYVRGGLVGPSGLTVTRASSGYAETSDGRLVEFGSGVLRRTDRGVLVEGARTNLLTYSQAFDDAYWAKNEGSLTANAIAAPDGSMTADLFIENTETGGHNVTSSNVSINKNIIQTLSAFVKNAGRNRCRLQINAFSGNSINASFDLTDGTVVSVNNVGTGSGATATIIPLSDGWFRITLTGTPSNVNASSVQCSVINIDSSSANYTGDGTSGIYIWGAQLEAASFPSSYIKTEGSTVTRAADQVTAAVNTTAQIQAAVAGQPELVTNGTFDADSDWTYGVGSGWSISAGVATFAGGTGDIGLYQSLSITGGKSYAVTITQSNRTAGNVTIRLGGTTNLALVGTTDQTYTFVVTAESASTNLGIIPTATYRGSIDNISVKEIPAGALTLYPLSLFAEFERVVDTGGVEILTTLSAGASDNDRSAISVNASDLARYLVSDGGVMQADMTVTGALAINTVYKIAGRTATNDVQMARGGTLGTQDTSVTLPNTPTLITVGALAGGAGGNQAFGYLRTAAIIPRALTDTELEAITT